MTNVSPQPLVLQALDALKIHERRRAADLLRQDMAVAAPTGKRWQSVAQLAGTIGETGLELEAMRRFAATEPQTLDQVLALCTLLARRARTDEALAIIASLPAGLRDRPSVLHFMGMAAAERGQFDEAESLFRRALAAAPLSVQTWFGLTLIKTFQPGDPDLAQMEALRSAIRPATPDLQTQWAYALAKAYDDAGGYGQAERLYRDGAAIMHAAAPYAAEADRAFAKEVVQTYSIANMRHLAPSGCSSDRPIFVNGLPRSGTTLVEQILSSHSQVIGGGELNLARPALIPAASGTFLDAKAYEDRSRPDDPWGDLGRDYLDMLRQRVGPDRRVVDKSLDQSAILGLILHMLPKAKVIWIRRNPEDCAMSAFRNHFKDSLNWTWSMADIAAHFRTEDILYAHWTRAFPDRILSVPYEGLVAEPRSWIPRMLDHVGLAPEPQVFEPHTLQRSVMTASVAQVRSPISAGRVGTAARYPGLLAEFQAAYGA